MRTLATATLPIPIVLALLFAPLQTLSGTAYACSCIETTEGPESGMFPDMDGVVRVSAYYKGSGPSEIAVDDPPHQGVCGIIGDDSVGREAVLFLELSDGEYLTHLCAGSQIIHGDEGVLAETIAAIEAVTGPGQPPDGSRPHDEPTEHSESTPWAVILPLAFAIPLAVLVVRAFLRRRGGH